MSKLNIPLIASKIEETFLCGLKKNLKEKEKQYLLCSQSYELDIDSSSSYMESTCEKSITITNEHEDEVQSVLSTEIDYEEDSCLTNELLLEAQNITTNDLRVDEQTPTTNEIGSDIQITTTDEIDINKQTTSSPNSSTWSYFCNITKKIWNTLSCYCDNQTIDDYEEINERSTEGEPFTNIEEKLYDIEETKAEVLDTITAEIKEDLNTCEHVSKSLNDTDYTEIQYLELLSGCNDCKLKEKEEIEDRMRKTKVEFEYALLDSIDDQIILNEIEIDSIVSKAPDLICRPVSNKIRSIVSRLYTKNDDDPGNALRENDLEDSPWTDLIDENTPVIETQHHINIEEMTDINVSGTFDGPTSPPPRMFSFKDSFLFFNRIK